LDRNREAASFQGPAFALASALAAGAGTGASAKLSRGLSACASDLADLYLALGARETAVTLPTCPAQRAWWLAALRTHTGRYRQSAVLAAAVDGGAWEAAALLLELPHLIAAGDARPAHEQFSFEAFDSPRTVARLAAAEDAFRLRLDGLGCSGGQDVPRQAIAALLAALALACGLREGAEGEETAEGVAPAVSARASTDAGVATLGARLLRSLLVWWALSGRVSSGEVLVAALHAEPLSSLLGPALLQWPAVTAGTPGLPAAVGSGLLDVMDALCLPPTLLREAVLAGMPAGRR